MAEDADLAAGLKMAKSKKMFFAFLPKGADGKLIVSKTKIPPKEIAEAKKELGSSLAVKGRCQGPVGDMTFYVAKEPPATWAKIIKTVAKRDAGLTVVANFQVAADAEVEDEGDAGGTPAAKAPEASAAAGAAPAAPGKPAPPAAAAQGGILGVQKALQKLGYNPGKLDGIDGPKTRDAVKQFQKAAGLAVDGIAGPKTQAALAKAMQGGAAAAGGAPAAQGAAPAGAPPAAPPEPPSKVIPPKAALNLGPWQAARQKAINELKALAGKVAGTKHGSAPGVLKEINFIIAKLPASPAANEIDKLMDFVKNDDTIKAAEDVPGHFHELDISEPLLKALEAARK